MKKAMIILLGVIALSSVGFAVRAQTSQTVVPPVTTQTVVDADANAKVQEAHQLLRAALMRGDAMYAPTYAEFYDNVAAAGAALDEAVAIVDVTTEGEELAQQFRQAVDQLHVAQEFMHLALQFGSDEYKPWYGSFHEDAARAMTELEEAMSALGIPR